MINKYGMSIVFLLLISCADEDNLPSGSELLSNTNLSEYPDSVFPWTPSKSEGIILGVSKEVFMTGNRSLFIENLDSTIARPSSWIQSYSGPMPAPGSSLELTAFLKGVDIRHLTPDGQLYIVFKTHFGGDRNTQGGFVGSASTLKLEGNFDWTLFSATLDNFPAEANLIMVELSFPTLTLGRIYFDEISLKVK